MTSINLFHTIPPSTSSTLSHHPPLPHYPTIHLFHTIPPSLATACPIIRTHCCKSASASHAFVCMHVCDQNSPLLVCLCLLRVCLEPCLEPLSGTMPGTFVWNLHSINLFHTIPPSLATACPIISRNCLSHHLSQPLVPTTCLFPPTACPTISRNCLSHHQNSPLQVCLCLSCFRVHVCDQNSPLQVCLCLSCFRVHVCDQNSPLQVCLCLSCFRLHVCDQNSPLQVCLCLSCLRLHVCDHLRRHIGRRLLPSLPRAIRVAQRLGVNTQHKTLVDI